MTSTDRKRELARDRQRRRRQRIRDGRVIVSLEIDDVDVGQRLADEDLIDPDRDDDPAELRRAIQRMFTRWLDGNA